MDEFDDSLGDSAPPSSRRAGVGAASRSARGGGRAAGSAGGPRTEAQIAIAHQFAEIMQQNELLAKENRCGESHRHGGGSRRTARGDNKRSRGVAPYDRITHSIDFALCSLSCTLALRLSFLSLPLSAALCSLSRLFDSFLQRNASLAAEQPEKSAKANSRRAHARPAHEPTISDVSTQTHVGNAAASSGRHTDSTWKQDAHSCVALCFVLSLRLLPSLLSLFLRCCCCSLPRSLLVLPRFAGPSNCFCPLTPQFDKHKIGLEELEYRTKQLSALEQKASEDISLLRAITSGIKLRMTELRKETYEFQRDIVVSGENERSGHVMAEKVLRYFETTLHAKQTLIDKLRLKNKAMKAHRIKMDTQVRHKEEQGDSLHSIDFHQLQIKNSQFNQKIKERNDELLKLKMTTGKTVQILNTLKKSLNDLLAESRALRKELKEKDGIKAKLAAELERVAAEVRAERAKNRKYKVQQSNPDMPQVMDYVTQKSIAYELLAAKRNWERKVEIVEMAAKRARRVMHAKSAGAAAAAGGQGDAAYQQQHFGAYSPQQQQQQQSSSSPSPRFGGTDTHLPRIY